MVALLARLLVLRLVRNAAMWALANCRLCCCQVSPSLAVLDPLIAARTVAGAGTVNTKKQAALDPNHSHFVLIDNEASTSWRSEIEMRAKIETRLREKLGVPIVLVVVQVGDNTFAALVCSCGDGSYQAALTFS